MLAPPGTDVAANKDVFSFESLSCKDSVSILMSSLCLIMLLSGIRREQPWIDLPKASFHFMSSVMSLQRQGTLHVYSINLVAL